MSKPIITIIGLGLTGTSLALGLQQEPGNFEIVGHDKDPAAASAAKKSGAVQRTEWNLYRACEKAEMIVLAVPLSEMDELLSLLREDLSENVLLLAITNVMQPAIEAAAKHLPAVVHFVVGHPILSGIGGSLDVRADLFDEVVFAISTGTETDPSAVQLASDFVERVGATPLFVDAQEHDGIIAGVEQLPQFLAAVLIAHSTSLRGWVEARRLAGRQFAQTTELRHGAEQLHDAFLANRENLLQRIDQLQQELVTWRQLLALDPLQIEGAADAASSPNSEEDEEHPLLAALKKAARERDIWETQAILKNWDETPKVDSIEGGSLLQSMFFGNLLSRRRGATEKKS